MQQSLFELHRTPVGPRYARPVPKIGEEIQVLRGQSLYRVRVAGLDDDNLPLQSRADSRWMWGKIIWDFGIGMFRELRDPSDFERPARVVKWKRRVRRQLSLFGAPE